MYFNGFWANLVHSPKIVNVQIPVTNSANAALRRPSTKPVHTVVSNWANFQDHVLKDKVTLRVETNLFYIFRLYILEHTADWQSFQRRGDATFCIVIFDMLSYRYINRKWGLYMLWGSNPLRLEICGFRGFAPDPTLGGDPFRESIKNSCIPTR